MPAPSVGRSLRPPASSTVIYARQSLDRDGSGAAVERQLAECRDLADRLSLVIAEEYVDNDVSASTGRRPQFARLLEAIKRGDVATIVVWHTDRLYRQVRDLVSIVETAERHALKIHTVRAGDLDLSTPAGRMLAGMLGHAARYEVEQKGARQVAANLQRAHAGEWQFSRRPFGYRRDGDRVVIVPDEAEIMREAFDRYLAGDTYYAIVEDFNARGIRTADGNEWSMTTLRARLRNPAYAGLRAYRGEIVGTGDWEPIITPETWERFNATIARRRTRHGWSNKTRHLLSGIIACGVCGGRMMARPVYQRRRNAPSVTTLAYACRERWCVQRDLARVDEHVEAAILHRLGQPDVLELLTPAIDVAPLAAEARDLRARRDDLAGLLADGTLTAAAVRRASEQLQQRLDEIQRTLDAAHGGSNLASLAMADDIAAHWRTRLNLPQRRAVIAALVDVRIHKQANTRRFDPADIELTWQQ